MEEWKVVMGVYQIKNRMNNKLYIGSSVNISKRWTVHKHDLNMKSHHNIYLQRAWDKYSEDSFEFTIIEEVFDRDDLLNREQYWMDKTLCYQNDKGYNNAKVAGNCIGVKHTEETRKKMSDSTKGFKHTEETKRKISNAHKGKTQPSPSEETRKKLSIAGKGRIVSDEVKEKIAVKQRGEKNHTTIFSNKDVMNIKYLLANFDLTLEEISNHYNVIFQTISNIKRGKTWSHLELDDSLIDLDEINILFKVIKSKSTRVSKIKLTKEDVIEIRKMLSKGISQKEIALIYNVDKSGISNIATGKAWKNVI